MANILSFKSHKVTNVTYLPIINQLCIFSTGTGTITKNELKYFYTAFMDAGKLGDQKLEEFTNDAYRNLTAVSKTWNYDLDFIFQKEICSTYQNTYV